MGWVPGYMRTEYDAGRNWARRLLTVGCGTGVVTGMYMIKHYEYLTAASQSM